MAVFTGTSVNETIKPANVSPTVTTNPNGSVPSAANDTLLGYGGNDTFDAGGGRPELPGAPMRLRISAASRAGWAP